METTKDLVQTILNSNEIRNGRAKVVFNDTYLYKCLSSLEGDDFWELVDELEYCGYQIRHDDEHKCFIID